MKKRQALLTGDVPFRQVAWGLTKDLVGPECMGSEHIRIKITEYQPGFSHKLHVHRRRKRSSSFLKAEGFQRQRTTN